MILPLKERYFITGKQKLSGDVHVPGSKNAALPILAASLAVKGVSTIENIPDLSDTRGFINIMKSLGAKIKQEGKTVIVDATNLVGGGEVDDPYISKMRASILFLAPLLVRFGRVKMPFPGGCVLGKRSVDTHLRAFEALGAVIEESTTHLELSLPTGEFIGNIFILPEMSVTATENALVAMAFANGKSQIRLAAAEPHVQNLCDFLSSTGVKIQGKGSHTLHIERSVPANKGCIHVTSDYLQVGTFILAGILTNSEITIHNFEQEHLDSFLERLSETGALFSINHDQKTITTKPRKGPLMAVDIQTGVFPKFPTDLHPQFAVLLTQCEGVSKIHEPLFERKFAYLLELEKMGADIELQNPHVFKVNGAASLQGVPVASQDIRAGAAMMLAGLVAEGETEISNIHYIHRGYENIEQTFGSIGAKIRKEG